MAWQRVPAGRIISPHDKALPAWAAGLGVDEFLARGPCLSDLWTPALIVADDALTGNAAFLAAWAARHGLELMPHGKTTMAPQLWRLQQDAGATALTLATPWQVRVARATGIRNVMLAGQIADPAAAAWLAQELGAPADCGRVFSWVDDPAGVDMLAAHAGPRPFEVLIELGRPGGRTGARSVAAALTLAARVRQSAGLRLAGVAGYEGAVAHGRDRDALQTVAEYVGDLVALHELLLDAYDDPADAIVTAGGSAFPDVVAAALADGAARLPGRYAVRSGAALIHDEGYYRSVSPFDGAGLRPAARAVARVVSAPEPGLTLLDAGRRDVPYDLDLPTPVAVLPASGGIVPAPAARISAVNDQHAFAHATAAVGDRVLLGLSHPCTMFDKWRLIPVVETFATDGDRFDPRVVGLIETRF